MTEEFAKLLYEVIGLDSNSIGLSSIDRAVRQRLAAIGTDDASAYHERLQSDRKEVQALVEAIVVPETWFFRDPQAFVVIRDYATKATRPGKLRFLCLPCSTGEEPYSLAMSLLDANIPTERFHIDAMDVSERALQHAQKGMYGRNSFRGSELAFRDRHFLPKEDGWMLHEKVRPLVHFHHGNLLDDASMVRDRAYDAIFCRNLLIYFDAETQSRAIRSLEQLLLPAGVFCVGPAETGLLPTSDFTPTRVPLSFAFRKEKPVAALPKARPVQPQAAKPFLSSPSRATLPAVPRVLPPILPPTTHPAIPDLSAARKLADEGRLQEAASICHAHISLAGPSTEAHYLLALFNDTAGRFDEAASHYRKTLYLDPQHHDALLHFSILMAKHGDTTTADSLRRRARRATEKAA